MTAATPLMILVAGPYRSGTDGDPALIGSDSRPRRLAQIAHPVSVCHQWSTTGTPSFSDAQ